MRRIVLIVVAVVVVGGIGGCAKREPAPAATTSTQATTTSVGVPAPADSPMAKVKPGMRPEDVVAVMGPPTHQRSYPTGKAWMPFYFGPDRWRSAYYYKGTGRVIFKGAGGFGSGSSVVHTEYDPTEPG